MTDLRLLEREMYAEAEAARLLDVAPSTLHYWLEGKTGRAGKVHRPVIRQEPKGTGAPVTWAEFVEAGSLRQYRRELKVRLPELRAFIDLLRESFNVPYPLADQGPYVSGRELVMQAQEAARLPGEFWLVTVAGGQLLLTSPSDLSCVAPGGRTTSRPAGGRTMRTQPCSSTRASGSGDRRSVASALK
jgi:hypothetical protein